MLGRRNLRVKVMQALYAWEIDRETSTDKLETLLQNQIQRSVSLYLTDLLFLAEVCRYSLVDKAKRMAKFVKTEEDEKASTTIAANRIVKYLETDGQFNSYLKKENIRHYINEDVVKSLFNDLASKERYKEYAPLQTPTIEQDKDIVNFILKKVLPANKSLETHLEELFINYDDDNSLLLHILTKYVEAFDETKNNFFQSLELWEEEKKFAHDLLKKTIENDTELTEYIKPNLKNWEMERVAILDLVLMKMALCEIKYFPTIPVKVSINEYIDVSKLYSTPKSKDFVNGVLDKAKTQMLERGEIKKFGRGLME
jgi:N utilization substance protein B